VVVLYPRDARPLAVLGGRRQNEKKTIQTLRLVRVSDLVALSRERQRYRLCL
jgi:hypothetical protein